MKIKQDKHLPIVFLSHKIVYKVAMGYIPYQLVYTLHLLMPTKYVFLVLNGDHKNANLVVWFLLINYQIYKKPQNDQLQIQETTKTQ
jgi:hypothetical protein